MGIDRAKGRGPRNLRFLKNLKSRQNFHLYCATSTVLNSILNFVSKFSAEEAWHLKLWGITSCINLSCASQICVIK